ncbi:MAG: hypothetical protein IPM69_16215 [Ignavibacteria bacterium]|nr:hypothetical protein [Ignavibacteria bacterium]
MIKLIYILIVMFVIGCGSNPSGTPVNPEHAPPTTVVMQFIRLDSVGKALDTFTCTVRDTANVKGKPRVEGGLNLLTNTKYLGSLRLLDESQIPAKDVTDEIVVEKDAHVFRYTVKGDDPNAIVISDIEKDTKGFDFGLSFRATTLPGKVTILAGVITLTLEHHDDGNKNGATFDTDINQDFPFVIK